MIGEQVEHPHYGRGIVLAAYRSGSEWLVRFESGLRFRRPRWEFAGQNQVRQETEAAPPPLPIRPPMPPSQAKMRRLIEALRFGVPPSAHLRELTIGLAAERESIITALKQSPEIGGAVRAVLGEYGHGKSHLVELSAQEALEGGFLVATASLDLLELPPHRAFDIYRELMHNLRTPESDEKGLGPLLRRADKLGLRSRLREGARLELEPLTITLEALANTSSLRQQHAWQSWLMGERRSRQMNKATPRGVRFPTIYRTGHNARQVAYLLSGISVLARLAGYRGLCVLIDEAESYSLLRAQQRPKATLFFAAMIHTAGGGREAIPESALPQHRFRHYPTRYGGEQSLFFLFTITHGENQLPLEEWLAPEEILLLAPHPNPQEITAFLQRLQDYHAQAYGYQATERQGQLRRAAAEHLSLAMKRARLGIRGLVRLSVELFDLAYLHPDYPVVEMIEELGSQFGASPPAPPAKDES